MHVCRSREMPRATVSPAGPPPMMRISVGLFRAVPIAGESDSISIVDFTIDMCRSCVANMW